MPSPREPEGPQGLGEFTLARSATIVKPSAWGNSTVHIPFGAEKEPGLQRDADEDEVREVESDTGE